MAVKALSLRGLADWKQLQLFEREAATLRGLSHPCIPAYLDYFEDDTERDRGFFLVQVSFTQRSFPVKVVQGIATQHISPLVQKGRLRRPFSSSKGRFADNMSISMPSAGCNAGCEGAVMCNYASGTLSTTVPTACACHRPRQELAEGRTLADLVASGWRADEGEAKRIAKELLGVLDYLGSRRPAVTHRCAPLNRVWMGRGSCCMLKHADGMMASRRLANGASGCRRHEQGRQGRWFERKAQKLHSCAAWLEGYFAPPSEVSSMSMQGREAGEHRAGGLSPRGTGVSRRFWRRAGTSPLVSTAVISEVKRGIQML